MNSLNQKARDKEGAVSKMAPICFDDEQYPKIKAYYKYEMAAMYQVCTKTFSAWIDLYEGELKEMGYTKHTRLLRPEIVRFLFRRLGEP